MMVVPPPSVDGGLDISRIVLRSSCFLFSGMRSYFFLLRNFENLYKGQISKSGVAILPSKRTRRIPEVKKPSLADEALSELKAEQPEIKEENLEKAEPLELNEEAPSTEENKPE